MDYPRNDELISAYLDRELSPDERAALDRVLEKSSEARERLNELEATSRFLRRLPPRLPEADFADAVIERLRSESLLRPAIVEPARPTRRISWHISGSLVAAAAGLLCAVWLIYDEPHRTPVSLGPLRTNAPDFGASTDDPFAQREQLRVGDAFDVLAPNGESRFQLIVFNEVPHDDAVRCVLVDKSVDAESVPRDKDASPRGDESVWSLSPRGSLQADQEQIDALVTVYGQANSLEDEPFPVVAISASSQPLRLKVGEVTAPAWPDVEANSELAKETSQPPSESGTEAEATSLAQRVEEPPATRSIASNRRRMAARDAEDKASVEAKEPEPAATEARDAKAMDEASGLASKRPAETSPSRSERGQQKWKIDSLVVQSDRDSQARQALGREPKEDAAPKKSSVGKIAELDAPRIGDHAVPKEKPPPGRVEALLRFGPEKSGR